MVVVGGGGGDGGDGGESDNDRTCRCTLKSLECFGRCASDIQTFVCCAAGVTYAGFVKLTASNPAALQADEASPTPQQLAVFSQQQQRMQPSQLQQQQAAMGVAAQGGTQVLDISRKGAVTIDGEPVVAANTRTAAVLRLLAKRAAGRSSNMFGGASDLGREIDRSSAIVSHLNGRRRSTSDNRSENRSDGTRQAIWAAMQTLMRTVSKIEKRQDKMGKTVERVRRVMRYRP